MKEEEKRGREGRPLAAEKAMESHLGDGINAYKAIVFVDKV